MASGPIPVSWAQRLESACSTGTRMYRQGLQQLCSRAITPHTDTTTATAGTGPQLNPNADLSHSGSLPSPLGQHGTVPSKDGEPLGESATPKRWERPGLAVSISGGWRSCVASFPQWLC